MSTIVVLGASGKAGRRIAEEAASRGHRVIGVVRDPDSADLPEGVEAQRGDAHDAASLVPVLEGADAVVVAVGGEDAGTWVDAATTVGAAAQEAGAHPYVIHMGGGATLLGPDGVPFLEAEGFPDAFRAPAEGQAAALAWYRSDADAAGLRWTYLSPPPVDFAPGTRVGAYRTGLDTPIVDDEGRSRISYEDFAIAVVDEAEQQRFAGRRFTVGY